MKVDDSLYTCGKHGNRLVYGNCLCDDCAPVFEQEAMEIVEKRRRDPPAALG